MRGRVSAFFFRAFRRAQDCFEKTFEKNPELSKAVFRKIKQIVELNDDVTIDHFKNLKHGLSDLKRVHVGNFVLLFRVFKEKNFILFYKLEHHDDVYK